MTIPKDLLPHLSDEALRSEARARGLSPECWDGPDSWDRSRVIAELRRLSASEMGSRSPLEAAPASRVTTQVPSESALETGAVQIAKELIGNLFHRARDWARSSFPPEPRREKAPKEGEPIQTRTMAELLFSQGEVQRAIAMLRQLLTHNPDDIDLQERLRRAERRADVLRETGGDLSERVRRTQRAEPGSFLRIVEAEGTHAAVWRVDDAALERARSVLNGQGKTGPEHLQLRTVSVIADPAGRVRREISDLPVQEFEGWKPLTIDEGERDPSSARLVVAIGLRPPTDEPKFVSIAHERVLRLPTPRAGRDEPPQAK